MHENAEYPYIHTMNYLKGFSITYIVTVTLQTLTSTENVTITYKYLHYLSQTLGSS